MKKLISILFLLITLPALASDPKGSYQNGELTDPECLQETGEGYMQLYRDVERIWGTMELVDLIVETGKEMNEKYPGRDRLQVEEMSAKHGGEIDGHASHENGLDVDIQYYKKDGKEHVPTAPRGYEGYYAPKMADKDGNVSENFDVERNWELMKTLFKKGRVAKIFVDEALKQKLCKYANEKGELKTYANVLRNITHVKNHCDHLHVRLQCPAGKKACRGEYPATSGPTNCKL